jgi:two-component system, chemotaxis family, protein-glutamate methylesterase/glutaminase
MNELPGDGGVIGSAGGGAIGLIVIGGSAGSLQVLIGLLSAVGPGLPIPILVLLHRNVHHHESSLEALISAKTKLTCKEVEEKEPLLPGVIYICPADYHVLIERDHSLSLDYSERVNYSRPSIDVTFKSAAEAYGPELICVLLSGANADGADGLEYARGMGSITVVQDPATAEVAYMPQYAIDRVKVDFVLRPEEMPGIIFPAPRG